MKLKICNIHTLTVYQQLFGSSEGREINARICANHFQPMFLTTLQIINGFINELQAGMTAVQPDVFPGLPEDERPLTDFEALTDDQWDCYTVIVVLAFKMGRLYPYHWANKNFEKARTMQLDSWYHMGLSIKT